MRQAPFPLFVGDILLDREGVLIRNLIKKEAVSLFLAGIGLFAGFCLVLSFFHSRKETGYLYFGFYLLTTGAWALAQTLSKQLLVQDAYFWRAVDLIALFQIPVWMASFYRRIFGRSKPGIFDAFWISHSIYAAITYILLLTGLSGPEPMLLPFQISSVTLLIVMMISSVHKSYSGDMEARLLFSGLVLLCLSGIHDFLNAMGILPWRAPISVYAILFPLLSGVIILIRRSFSDPGEALQNSSFKPLFIILQTKFGLTYQEARICCDIAEGKERAALRKDLNIAESTLKSQLRSIYKKTIEKGVNRAQDRRDKMQRLTVFLHRLASEVQ